MSPFTRMRTLAAALALLLFLAATPVVALPGRPQERPEGPGPNPQEVGEPDTGHGLPTFGFDEFLRHMIGSVLVSHPGLRAFAFPFLRMQAPPAARTFDPRR